MKVFPHLCGYNGKAIYDKDNLQLGSDWKWHIFSFQNHLQLLFGISLEEIQSVMCYSAGIAAYRRRIRRRISLFVVQITCTLIWTKANIISILLSGCSTIQFYLYIFIAFLKINLNIVFL